MGDGTPRTATTTLQVYVSQLRKVLAEAGGSAHSGELLTRAPGYLLAVPERDFDLPCFERLRAEGRAAYQEGDFGRASGLLHEALALWTGPALSGIPHGVRLESAAIRLDELRMEVLEQRIVADLRLGRHQELAGELLALANEHPLRETLHGHLMVALYRTGRGSDALRVYGRLRHSSWRNSASSRARACPGCTNASCAGSPPWTGSRPAPRAARTATTRTAPPAHPDARALPGGRRHRPTGRGPCPARPRRCPRRRPASSAVTRNWRTGNGRCAVDSAGRRYGCSPSPGRPGSARPRWRCGSRTARRTCSPTAGCCSGCAARRGVP
ncbi:AfsR/SARP family transcriptional regulator [Streptomyces neyagawaensis]|uniref:AfsR/SARP family transcriptional regulator n=1 Tax=Streptomyces neyagawaensis TaxID=42238 RepID=UPI003EBA9076